MVCLEDIRVTEAKEKVVEVQTAEGTFLTDQTLDILEQRLNPREFLRPLRSYIVRTRVIAELAPWFSDSYVPKPDGGMHVPIAQRRLAEICECWKSDDRA